ncbi:MAG: DNA-binding response regulator [Solirubrobacterales bacterium]|nr:DNA-binding response regulator [Solirubrobacterales bacterium]
MLEAEGCHPLLASHEDEVLQLLKSSGAPDAAILDVCPQGTRGLGLCRLLRRLYVDLPLLLVSAADDVEHRVAGLDAGADDYVGKPFAPEEVAARLRVLLRRTGLRRMGAEVLRYGRLELNRTTRQAYRTGEELELTRTEFDLLELFLLYPGDVLKRSFIYERVWGYDVEFSSNSLEVYVSLLRAKLEQHDRPRVIQTVRGVGYVLRTS